MDALPDILSEIPAYHQFLTGAASRAPTHSLILEVQDPSLGRALTRAWLSVLYCQSPSTGSPCGTCTDCIQVSGGTHPGVVPIEPDGMTIRVEQVREDVLTRVGKRVPGGRHQVFVFHGAECLGEESGNALLKAVEEPPPQTVFLFLAEDRQAMLGTIRSRSQELAIPLPALAPLLAFLHEKSPIGAAALLAAGLAPGILAALHKEGAPPSSPEDELPLDDLAAGVLSELEDGEILSDPRASAHRVSLAVALFSTALKMLVTPEQSQEHARLAHAFADASGSEARKRAKAIKGKLLKEYGDGFEHPTLRRDAAFARQASTKAAEDLMRAMTAVLVSALRLRAGEEPHNLVSEYPLLQTLASRPAATLLGKARRIRKARGPLRRNQNLRLLFDELFLDLEGAKNG